MFLDFPLILPLIDYQLGRALNQTTEDTFEEYDVDSQEMELWDHQISEREGDEVED